MLVFEAKLKGLKDQYFMLDEAIRTARFVRNSCLRYWMEGRSIGRYNLSAYCAVLAKDFPWANKLNSQARQAHAERAWSAIARFFDNCKKNKPGKKGYPRFKKEHSSGSVEYKTTGWKLSECRRYITFTDGFGAGTFKLWGTRDLHFYQLKQIKRVRVVRRADGYYTQFCIDQERLEKKEPTFKTIGLDVGYLIQNNSTKQQQQRLYFFLLCKYSSIQNLIYTAIHVLYTSVHEANTTKRYRPLYSHSN
jgi:putative transposase